MRKLLTFRWILVVLWTAVAGLVCAIAGQSSESWTPDNTMALPWSDHTDRGQSQILRIDTFENGWAVHLKLRQGAPWPNAGILLRPRNGQCQDFHKLQRLTFHLRAGHSSSLTAVALQGEQSLQGSAERSRTLYHFITIPNTAWNTYSLELREFFIPEWLVLQFGLQDKRQQLLWDEHCALALVASNYTPKDTVEVLEISNLGAQGVHLPVLIGCGLLWGVGILGLTITFLRNRAKVKTKTKVLVPIFNPLNEQKTSTTPDLANDPWISISTYLASAFAQPEITTESAARECKMPSRRFTEIVKKNTGLGPKEYITQLRIACARQLLHNADLQIQEVAYTSGFNSIPHFNRVFKAETGQTPSEFRSSLRT